MNTRRIKVRTIWLLTLLLALTAFQPLSYRIAEARAVAVEFPAVTAESAIVIARESGEELGSKNPDTVYALASTTKIMTALIAIECTKSALPTWCPKRVGLNDRVTVGENPPQVGGTKMKTEPDIPGEDLQPNQRLETGEELTLYALLYGMMLPSGNDAALAVAEHVAGSESSFVSLMNTRAVRLGLSRDTEYKNPHGLRENGHESNARDLARLARYALNEPVFAQIVRTSTFTVTSTLNGATKTYNLQNTNNLLNDDPYPGANGVKTGTTNIVNLVSTATLLGKSVIVVVMGSADHESRYTDSKKLLDYGFDVLFNVNRKAEAAQTGVISELQIAPVGTDHVVTALRDSDGKLQVSAWRVSAGGAITLAGTYVDNLTGPVSEVALDTLGTDKVAVAVRDSNGRVKLITWSVDRYGRVTRLGDSGSLGRSGNGIAVRALSGSRVITAMRYFGYLELVTWMRDSDDNWTQSSRYTSALLVDRLGLTSYCTRHCGPDSDPSDPDQAPSFRVITGVRDNADNLRLISWDIDSDGRIVLHLDRNSLAYCTDPAGCPTLAKSTSEVAISYQRVFDKNRIITAARNSSGNLELLTWRFSDDGTRIERLADSGTQAGQTLSEIRMAGLAIPGWVMTALQTSASNLKLISWRLPIYAKEITRFIDSDSQAGFVSKIALCQLTGNTYVTATTASDGTLKLISWKVESE